MPSKVSVPSSGITWIPNSYSENAPASMPSAIVAAMEVGVAPGGDLSLFPNQ